MGWDFDQLLTVAPDVRARETLSARYLERARDLRDVAEECRLNREDALAAAQACERFAERIAPNAA